MGFSGSSPTNYIAALYASRLAGKPVVAPRVIRPGSIPYSNPRWGDYSATTVDPTDDWSFWTVQEYAAPCSFVGEWETVIAKIRPSP